MKPGLDRILGLLESMADPHRGYAVIHVAGTNGKTSTARIIASVIEAHGLSVGTFTSPHLERVEERFSVDGRTMSEEEFATAVADVAPFVDLFEQRTDDGITYFELTAAMAFAWFAEQAVDVAVIEVGLGGRLDATNVVDPRVAVITGIASDHTEYLGESLGEIATEKAGIVKPESVLVTGPLPAEAEKAVAARVAETGVAWRRYDTDYHLDDAIPAVGGWMCDVEGVYERYEEVLLKLHGRHQTRNLAVAIAAVEELLGRAASIEAVRTGAAIATSPGRLEVVRRRPLTLIDGAHNVQGFEALADALAEEFLPTEWTLVFGTRGTRDAAVLLAPIRDQVRTLVVTAPDDPQAVPPDRVAKAARQVLAESVDVIETRSVPEAVSRALSVAGTDGAVLVAGSLYVIGEARHLFSNSDNGVAFPDRNNEGNP